jgi:hypothetical protein
MEPRLFQNRKDTGAFAPAGFPPPGSRLDGRHGMGALADEERRAGRIAATAANEKGLES